MTLLVPAIALAGSRDQKEIKRSYPVSGDASAFVLAVENIQGDVIIEGYEGRTIELSLNITVDAYNQQELDQAMEELELDEISADNHLLLRMKAPFVRYGFSKGIDGGGVQCEGPDYRYAYDFKLRIPKGVLLRASTINDGRIRISDVAHVQHSSNINGPIVIDQVNETVNISTINGNIDITYASRPSKDGQFHTINGDITLELPDDFTAQVEAESMQGDLFSAFDYEVMPQKMQVSKEQGRKGMKYQIEDKTVVKIGNSTGPLFRFETLNGDMFLRKI